MSKSVDSCLVALFAFILGAGTVLFPAVRVDAQVGDMYTAKVKTSGGYESLRTKAVQDGTVRIIVGVDASFTPDSELEESEAATQRSAIATVQARLLKALADTGNTPAESYRYTYSPYIAMKVSAAALDALLQSDSAVTVHEDLPSSFHLDKSVPIIGAKTLHGSGVTGSGYIVAIVDTGVLKTHPFLQGSVVAEACYSTNDAARYATSVCKKKAAQSTDDGSAMPYVGKCPVGSCDHGTHVAGIVAGRDVGGISPGPGVAPDAKIIAIQVATRIDNVDACAALDADSPCVTSYTSDQKKALERVYTLRNDYKDYKIASVNMSLGIGRYTAPCDSDPLKASIDNLRSAGIATVVATGNRGYCGAIESPSCVSSAVSVGATVSTLSSDAVAGYSNSASFMTLLAPGDAINSSLPPKKYDTEGGTSMAAPHVAGAFALLRQSRPAATVTEMVTALASTGKSLTDSKCASVTKRRINVYDADESMGTNKLLTVAKKGAGAGTVTSDPVGISCGTRCAAFFENDGEVTLTAAPSTGNSFTGWSGGGCSGTGTCTVTMSDAVTVTAAFGSSCAYSVSPSHISAPYKGKEATIIVTASGAGACGGPSVVTSESWITASLTSFANNSGTIKVTVRPNDTWTPRTGTISIAGIAFAVNQRQTSCSPPKITPRNAAFTSAGGRGSFTVDVNGECAWTTTVDFFGASWITINSGSSGTGEGPVNYTVAANTTGKARTGIINIYRTGSSDWKMFFVKQAK